MKFSVPFLATDIEQLPFLRQYDHDAVEAILFKREDLKEDRWDLSWRNIEQAVKIYGGEQVSFHFPIKDSQYVEDPFVFARLLESLQRASDLNLRGVVVHSNQLEPLPWTHVDMPLKRAQVIEALLTIREKVKGNSFIALENMPVMDNSVLIDPLFAFPVDFAGLMGTEVKIIWDVCHFTNTIANIAEVMEGKQKALYYPNIQQVDYLDFLSISSQIIHWHFSAFKGVANPETGSTCKEGVHPSKSDFGELIYRKSLGKILECAPQDQHIVFEIQEENYLSRVETEKTIKWARSVVPG